MADNAYIAALKMLGRRELSEVQIRQRLARRGHEADDIEAAIVRLMANRSLDDARVAGAIARTATAVRGRGRLRVRRQLQAAGIDAETAQRALEAVFDDIDPDALLESSLAKRLADGDRIADDRQFQRLFRYLIGQGFEADRVLALLRRRRK